MIAANVQAALFLEKRKIPALFRAHEPPPAEKYEDLQQFLREFKLRMPSVDEVTPADFAEILTLVRDRPERELIQSVLLRSQSMAAYQPDNRGHFGLALAAHAHLKRSSTSRSASSARRSRCEQCTAIAAISAGV